MVGLKTTDMIICAAIHYHDKELNPSGFGLPSNIKEGLVIGGWRHPDCIAVMWSLTKKQPRPCNYSEGFLTHDGRFLNRVEALEEARKCNQILPDAIIMGNELYSEDIY